MRNIRVSVAYDGTDFVGWQNQDSGRSVQGVVEAALAEIHKHPVTIYGAGRTDSGVHAAGQVFNFYSEPVEADIICPIAAVLSFRRRPERIIKGG